MRTNNVTILSWNIQSRDGPADNKLNDKEFSNHLTSVDIFCLQECRKPIKVPKYVCLNKLRNNSTGGGVTIGYSRKLQGGVKKFDTGNKIDLLAVTLNKDFFKRKRDILLITCYIPPSNSSYLKKVKKDPFADLLTLLEEVGDKYDIVVCGDLNSRCQLLEDLNLCTDIPGVETGPDNYDDISDVPERNNRDKMNNAYTSDFMEVLAQANITIRNGRTLGDMFGEFTHFGYGGASTVDYFLASHTIPLDETTLTVRNMTKYSDHKPVKFTLYTPLRESHDAPIKDHDDMPTQYRWTEQSKYIFRKAQMSNGTRDQIRMLLNMNPSSQDDITNLNAEITKLLHHIADSSLEKKSSKGNRPRNKQNWFDHDCRTAKRSLQAAVRYLNKNNKDTRARLGFFTARKEYRATLNRKRFQYNLNINKDIESIDNRNINWATLKKIKNAREENTPFDEYDLDSFFNFFKDLYTLASPIAPDQRASLLLEATTENERLIQNMNNYLINLNDDITLEEITASIKHLSNGKSVSLDLISNEMLKNLNKEMTQLLLKLFNTCLCHGIYPWNTSTITPILKGGDPYNPDNYRAIALGSCIGKLFSSILLLRINSFRNYCCPDSQNQLGFKKGAQTGDHILTLKTVVDKHIKQQNKKLYTCFVDFRKAFDSVAREAVLYKIANIGIGGNVFRVLKNMYENTSTRIKLINKLSDHIYLKNGVEQGHPLSPELFKIFIHDLSMSLNSVTDNTPRLDGSYVTHLFWADDLVLLALEESTLQRLVTILEGYCSEWGLTINPKKTKILIFNKSGRMISPKTNIMLNGKPIESTDRYCYLGILFVPSCKFKVAMTR